MAGRRQVWAGIALLSLMSSLTFLLPLSALGSSWPGAGWEAATLVAAALVVAVCAHRMVAVPAIFAVTGPVSGSAKAAAPVLFRLSPDSPGRPQRPRAPGHARSARPS